VAGRNQVREAAETNTHEEEDGSGALTLRQITLPYYPEIILDTGSHVVYTPCLEDYTMRDSRAKGNRNENAVCRLLTAWLVPELADAPVDDLPFRRRQTVIRAGLPGWEGQRDTMYDARVVKCFPFCVEAKCEEGWVLDGLLTSDNGKWKPWRWWQQAVDQADKFELEPLLIFTRSRYEQYVLMRKAVAQCLKVEPKNGQVADVAGPGLTEPLTVLLMADLMTVPPPRLKRLRDVTRSAISS